MRRHSRIDCDSSYRRGLRPSFNPALLTDLLRKPRVEARASDTRKGKPLPAVGRGKGALRRSGISPNTFAGD